MSIPEYLASNPQRFGYMYPEIRELRQGGDIVTYIFNFGERVNRYRYRGTSIELIALDGNLRTVYSSASTNFMVRKASDRMSVQSVRNFEHKTIWTHPLLDLVSLFTIYKESSHDTIENIRSNIIAIFDSYTDDYRFERDPLTTYLYKAYLMMNAYMLDEYAGELESFTRDEDLEAIQNEIDGYIPVIRTALVRLE